MAKISRFHQGAPPLLSPFTLPISLSHTHSLFLRLSQIKDLQGILQWHKPVSATLMLLLSLSLPAFMRLPASSQTTSQAAEQACKRKGTSNQGWATFLASLCVNDHSLSLSHLCPSTIQKLAHLATMEADSCYTVCLSVAPPCEPGSPRKTPPCLFLKAAKPQNCWHPCTPVPPTPVLTRFFFLLFTL